MAALSGFIKLHRKLVAWGWYDDDVVKSVFLHILLTANFKETTWRNITLMPGQVVTSIKKLSEDLQHTNQQTRTALDKLKSTNEITIKSTNKFSIITVVNWEEYQSDNDESNKQNNRQNNNQITNKQQATQQAQQQQRKKYKNKECKEYSNKGVYYIANSDEKNCYGKYNNVLLTRTEYEEVYSWDEGFTLERFSERMHTRGYKYDNHYQALIKWREEDKKLNRRKQPAPKPEKAESNKSRSYDLEEFERRAEQLPVYKGANKK